MNFLHCRFQYRDSFFNVVVHYHHVEKMAVRFPEALRLAHQSLQASIKLKENKPVLNIKFTKLINHSISDTTCVGLTSATVLSAGAAMKTTNGANSEDLRILRACGSTSKIAINPA